MKMSRNYLTIKTGHKPSDIYFKNQPLWCDSDLLKSFILGSISGAIFTVILYYVS